jgi:hypothetical protein
VADAQRLGRMHANPGAVGLRVGQSLPGMPAVVDRTPRTPAEGEDVNVNIRDKGDGDDTLTVFFAAVPWDDLDGNGSSPTVANRLIHAGTTSSSSRPANSPPPVRAYLTALAGVCA